MKKMKGRKVKLWCGISVVLAVFVVGIIAPNFSFSQKEEIVLEETLFSDEFSGEKLDWEFFPLKDEGHWEIDWKREVLKRDPTETKGKGLAMVGDAEWENYQVTARVRAVVNEKMGVVFRARNKDNGYILVIDPADDEIWIDRVIAGERVEKRLAQETFVCDLDEWYKVTIEVESDTLKVWIDDQLKMRVADSTFSKGKVGFFCDGGGHEFDYIKVTKSQSNLFFSDDFSSKKDDWEFINGGWRVNVENEMLTRDLPEKKIEGLALVGDASWRNYIVVTKIRSRVEDNIGVVFRVKDKKNGYVFFMNPEKDKIWIQTYVHGELKSERIGETNFNCDRYVWYSIRIRVEDEKIKVWVDERLKIDIENDKFTKGRVGFFSWGGDDFDYLQVIRIKPKAASLLPDIVIKDVTFLPEKPSPGERVIIKVKVTNTGEEKADEFDGIFKWWWLNKKITGEEKFIKNRSLSPGETNIYKIDSFVPEKEGAYTFRIIVDSNDKIKESDEGNNTYSAVLVVKKSGKHH